MRPVGVVMGEVRVLEILKVLIKIDDELANMVAELIVLDRGFVLFQPFLQVALFPDECLFLISALRVSQYENPLLGDFLDVKNRIVLIFVDCCDIVATLNVSFEFLPEVVLGIRE